MDTITEESSGSPENPGDPTPFCVVADEYDLKFTDRPLGRRKRTLVHDLLAPLLREETRLLELNCGTGEDALHFAPHVASILATDASAGMIAFAEEKMRERMTDDREENSPVRFAIATIEEIAEGSSEAVEKEVSASGPFDLIFSNFDGINCIESVDRVARGLMRLLRPGGEIVLVFMTRHPLLEKIRDFLRGRLSRVIAGRAKESGDRVSIGSGETIRTWFPPVIEVEKGFQRAGFVPVRRRAIGLFLPPTTMEAFYDRRPGLFGFLERFEKPLGGLPVLDRCGDHVLLHLRRPEMCERA